MFRAQFKHRYATRLKESRKAVEGIEAEGMMLMGSFHSHPIGYAKPGKGDLQYAIRSNVKFLLIYDVCGRDAKLWRLKRTRGKYGFCSERLRLTN